MSKDKPFLGETTDRARAFPGIESLNVSITQDLWEHYAVGASQRNRSYTLDNIPKRLYCVNPRCRQGGLDLQEFAVFWPNGEHRISCSGHEGSPAGRRIGDPCDNLFIITLTKNEK
jgi:hypothetical protein